MNDYRGACPEVRLYSAPAEQVGKALTSWRAALAGVTTEDVERLKALKPETNGAAHTRILNSPQPARSRENRILRKASAFIAQAEPDRRLTS